MDEQAGSKQPDGTAGWGRGLVGAVLGGGAGYFIFGWLAGQGFYAVALPGVLLGVGAGWLGRGNSTAFSLGCGVLGLGLGVFSEWAQFPFIKDSSFGYFIRHFLDLKPISLLMISLGGAAAFWFAWRGGVRAGRLKQ